MTTATDDREIVIADVADAAPLTTQEAQDLTRYETTIQRGIETFVEVGNALMAINRSRLYCATHLTFESYIEERWPELGGRRQVYQLMGAAEAVGDVTNWSQALPPPANEAQARPLTTLPPEERGPAWQQAVATAPGGKMTAAHVQQVVEERKAPAAVPARPAPAPMRGAAAPPPLLPLRRPCRRRCPV